jgi:hypothetical protein
MAAFALADTASPFSDPELPNALEAVYRVEQDDFRGEVTRRFFQGPGLYCMEQIGPRDEELVAVVRRGDLGAVLVSGRAAGGESYRLSAGPGFDDGAGRLRDGALLSQTSPLFLLGFRFDPAGPGRTVRYDLALQPWRDTTLGVAAHHERDTWLELPAGRFRAALLRVRAADPVVHTLALGRDEASIWLNRGDPPLLLKEETPGVGLRYELTRLSSGATPALCRSHLSP